MTCRCILEQLADSAPATVCGTHCGWSTVCIEGKAISVDGGQARPGQPHQNDSPHGLAGPGWRLMPPLQHRRPAYRCPQLGAPLPASHWHGPTPRTHPATACHRTAGAEMAAARQGRRHGLVRPWKRLPQRCMAGGCSWVACGATAAGYGVLPAHKLSACLCPFVRCCNGLKG